MRNKRLILEMALVCKYLAVQFAKERLNHHFVVDKI